MTTVDPPTDGSYEGGRLSRRAAATATTAALALALALAACGSPGPAAKATGSHPAQALPSDQPSTTHASTTQDPSPTSVTSPPGTSPQAATTVPATPPASVSLARTALAPPTTLTAFGGVQVAGEGAWRPAGRPVDGIPAVYETSLVPPGGTQAAGIAWMDTSLLSARLYSGSLSPGGGPYEYTAAIQPAQAVSLVAAFNGGFQGAVGGGYYTQGRVVHPLVPGDASLVIYADGNVTIGAWGRDVTMSRQVVGVRQNLVPLVAGGRPTAQASNPDWLAWGGTCGATSCSGPGIEHQWRSGAGVTADGALLYVTGPSLDPLQLAELLVRAGAVRAMQLDINPDWTVLATYRPSTPHGLASPSNGSKLLASTVQGPWTFFEPWWARDFITMSARSAASHG